MELRLEICCKKESKLSFLNSLKAFLKEKLEKGNLAGYSVAMSTETAYSILFGEFEDDREETTPIADHTSQSPQT